MSANNGTGFPDLFVGAMAESTGWGADVYPVERDAEFAANVNSTGCSHATNPIDCMRGLNITEFQSRITQDGWGPTVDGGRFLTAPVYQMFEQGRFMKIPLIIGSMFSPFLPSPIKFSQIMLAADLLLVKAQLEKQQ